MGRNKSFDEDEVLEHATERFRRHGYAGTSMRDLEAAMGMGTASLYHAFGDKHSLYRRALQHYLDATTRRRAALLDESADPRGAIGDFLSAIVEASAHSRDGCLLVNSAAELAAHDAELSREVDAGFREIEAALGRAVVRAQSEGSIARRLEPEALARSILSTVIALRVMARMGTARRDLQALADVQMTLMAREARTGLRDAHRTDRSVDEKRT